MNTLRPLAQKGFAPLLRVTTYLSWRRRPTLSKVFGTSIGNADHTRVHSKRLKCSRCYHSKRIISNRSTISDTYRYHYRVWSLRRCCFDAASEKISKGKHGVKFPTWVGDIFYC